MQLGLSSLLARMRGVNVAESAAYRKGAELVEDLREKYETSDHPMVHKVEVRGRMLLFGTGSLIAACLCMRYSSCQRTGTGDGGGGNN